MLLSQLITISSLLLGFVVTGCMLSLSMTGTETYSIDELIEFMTLAGLSAIFATMSLVLAFLSSIRGATAMEMKGVLVAEYVITTGSALKTIIAEMCIYLSLFFFLGGMWKFLSMVYTGPSFCPSYEGQGSMCSQLGTSFYFAAKQYCKPLYGQYPCKTTPICEATTSPEECLCMNYCREDWEQIWDYGQMGMDRPAGVMSHWYDWFGYYAKSSIAPATREKFVTASSGLSCALNPTTSAYDKCLLKHGDKKYLCAAAYNAWQKAVECADNQVIDANKCSKVCYWSGNTAPRDSVKSVERLGVLPVLIILGCLLIGRGATLCCRCFRQVRSKQAMKENLGIADWQREIDHDLDTRAQDDEAGDEASDDASDKD